jgi:hypothetical protein
VTAATTGRRFGTRNRVSVEDAPSCGVPTAMAVTASRFQISKVTYVKAFYETFITGVPAGKVQSPMPFTIAGGVSLH